MNNNNKYFIIDFDSTFIQVEALEELAKISLKSNPDKPKILAQIRRYTELGIEGDISFQKSLQKRIELIQSHRDHLQILINRLKRKVSISIKRNKEFFKRYSDSIYIVSGGFREFIYPIVCQYHIAEENLFANTFKFDVNNNIIGFDEDNELAQHNGKVHVLKSLHLKGDIYVIGDGYTDYQIKEAGLANKFYAFTENVQRDSILEKADHVAPSFEEFLYLNKLPMAISYPKNRINVLLLENVHPRAQEIFKTEGYNIETYQQSFTRDELKELIKNTTILGIRSKTKIDSELLRHANRLMAIGAFCIGTDQINLAECSEKGVAVFNAPYSNTRSVVELAIGEIIMLIRSVFEKSNKLHQGIWDKSSTGNYEVRGKKLGIIGYGNIGSQLSILAEAIGMDVYYYDIVEKLPLGNARKCDTMKQLLRKVDIVSVHVSGDRNNFHLISTKEFQQMKKGVIFLNLSRGFIVDLQALIKYLQNKKVYGAAIDVFENEPKSNSEKFICELQKLTNVILTPHIGGSTVEAQRNIAEFVPGKIIDYINSGNSILSVNFPNIQLPELHKVHRLIHIHKNIPGMLAQINSVLGKYNINIEGQYLKTNKEIGYVITDISKGNHQDLIRDLRTIPNTIKFRILY